MNLKYVVFRINSQPVTVSLFLTQKVLLVADADNR